MKKNNYLMRLAIVVAVLSVSVAWIYVTGLKAVESEKEKIINLPQSTEKATTTTDNNSCGV